MHILADLIFFFSYIGCNKPCMWNAYEVDKTVYPGMADTDGPTPFLVNMFYEVNNKQLEDIKFDYFLHVVIFLDN